MKHLFTFFLAAISVSLFAQNLQTPRGNELSPAEKQSYNNAKKQFQQHPLNKTNATDGGWYNYADALDQSTLGTITAFYYEMFNDSTVRSLYKDANSVETSTFVYTHNIGMAIDPRGICYDAFPFMGNRFTKYTMDSIGIPYGYRRHNPNPNIVDTMEVQVYAASAGKFVGFTGIPTIATTLDYTYTSNEGKTPFTTVKIPLTIADTADGLKFQFVVLNPPLSIPARGQAYVSYKYISGQTYSFGDTINADYNPTTYPVTNTLNELRGFINHDGQNYDESLNTNPVYNKIYNNGLIAFNDIRYNVNANGWDGMFVPGNAYGTHLIPDISMKITALNVGINAAVSDLLKDVQVYPNPTNGANAITVDYKLAKTANVSMDIMNILGKKLISLNSGKMNAGMQSQAINVEALADGIYFVNIYVDGNQQTVKFTVAK